MLGRIIVEAALPSVKVTPSNKSAQFQGKLKHAARHGPPFGKLSSHGWNKNCTGANALPRDEGRSKSRWHGRERERDTHTKRKKNKKKKKRQGDNV